MAKKIDKKRSEEKEKKKVSEGYIIAKKALEKLKRLRH